MNDLFQTNGIYFDNCIKHIKKMSNYYILKPSLSSNNFCIFLDSRYLQWTQSIFTTNFSTDCSQKKMHCAQLQADKKEFVSKCQSFQYFLALFNRIHLFYYVKVKMANVYYLQMWIFCHMTGQIQSKPIYVKQFWLNLL